MDALLVPDPFNEPVLSYAPATPERAQLEAELRRQAAEVVEIPLHIGAKSYVSGSLRPFSSPHRHSLTLGHVAQAEPKDVALAIDAARAAKTDWERLPFQSRAAVFLRAANLLAGPWRQRINAATMLNQSKTSHQAEIDAACELCDFFRYNVAYAARSLTEPLVSTRTEHNRFDTRPLDGFVFAVTPFNFTSIAANLPTAPALLGNTVVWKPSPLAALSGEYIVQLLREAGLPPGVINVVHGDAAAICDQVVSHPDFSGLHFTGSTGVFQSLWGKVAQNLGRYRSYPRLVGETGGKDFIFAHPSADVTALAVAIVRGAFEFQGQKCSAASRVYVPRSLWKTLEPQLLGLTAELKLGDPTDFRNFVGAVIGRQAYDRITGYQKLAAADPECEVLAGGKANDQEGFFVEPTIVLTRNPKHRLMSEEIFGPFVTLWVYKDAELDQALELCDQTTPYALTGAVFAQDRQAVEFISERLRFAAGNFYINDKPTGAVVGQQPFGGARLSGTNDKAGSAYNLLRWASPRVIKENFLPPKDWRYPFLGGTG